MYSINKYKHYEINVLFTIYPPNSREGKSTYLCNDLISQSFVCISNLDNIDILNVTCRVVSSVNTK